MAGVGTQRVFEDDRVIVWHLDLEPGEHGEQHTHQLDCVVRVFSGSTVEVFGPDGKSLYTVERKAGDVVGLRMDGDQLLSNERTAVPATHSVRNVGTNRFKEVLIEFKQ